MKNAVSPSRAMALAAGWALVLMAVAAGFAYGYGFTNLYVASDASATLANLQKNEVLFRSVILGFLVVLGLDVLVAWALQAFFGQGQARLSTLAAWFRIAYVGLLGVAVLGLVNVLPVLAMPNPDKMLVHLYLRQFLAVWFVGLIVFGLHLGLLACLMFRAGFVPRILSVLMLFASLCYIFHNALFLILPAYTSYREAIDAWVALPMAVGELGFAIWLIARAGKN